MAPLARPIPRQYRQAPRKGHLPPDRLPSRVAVYPHKLCPTEAPPGARVWVAAPHGFSANSRNVCKCPHSTPLFWRELPVCNADVGLARASAHGFNPVSGDSGSWILGQLASCRRAFGLRFPGVESSRVAPWRVAVPSKDSPPEQLTSERSPADVAKQRETRGVVEGFGHPWREPDRDINLAWQEQA